MITGDINDDGTVTVAYPNGRIRKGHIDQQGNFHDLK